MVIGESKSLGAMVDTFRHANQETCSFSEGCHTRGISRKT